jgi:hypothetical protein
MNVFELARLRLLDLQARYLELLTPYQRMSPAAFLEIDSMSREQLVECLLTGRP